jgi:transcriptional regulator with XRE-family HTH domain
MGTTNRTVSEWEGIIGAAVRDLRVQQRLDQAALAERANVSRSAVSNIERGHGSTLGTLIAIVRALGQTEWLDTLAPAVTISPMQMLKTRTQARPMRVRRPRARQG